jgi:hypothetical protein
MRNMRKMVKEYRANLFDRSVKSFSRGITMRSTGWRVLKRRGEDGVIRERIQHLNSVRDEEEWRVRRWKSGGFGVGKHLLRRIREDGLRFADVRSGKLMELASSPRPPPSLSLSRKNTLDSFLSDENRHSLLDILRNPSISSEQTKALTGSKDDPHPASDHDLKNLEFIKIMKAEKNVDKIENRDDDIKLNPERRPTESKKTSSRSSKASINSISSFLNRSFHSFLSSPARLLDHSLRFLAFSPTILTPIRYQHNLPKPSPPLSPPSEPPEPPKFDEIEETLLESHITTPIGYEDRGLMLEKEELSARNDFFEPINISSAMNESSDMRVPDGSWVEVGLGR